MNGILAPFIDKEFTAAQKVQDDMNKGLGFGWKTRVKAGEKADRIVARRKGIKLSTPKGYSE